MHNYQSNKDKDRNFICPCGKSYLSAPALYTHVKFKHNSKAPGELIKPISMPRGRRARSRGNGNHLLRGRRILAQDSWRRDDNEEEEEQMRRKKNLNEEKLTIQQELNIILQNFRSPLKINFQSSEGSFTCQDVASIFYRRYSTTSFNVASGLACFFKQLETGVQFKFGEGFWSKENPDEIIDAANLVCQLHQQDSPLQRSQLVKLLLLFFRWMYQEKWTDHQLQKKLQYTARR